MAEYEILDTPSGIAESVLLAIRKETRQQKRKGREWNE